jgi:hypothetical protein
VVGKLGGGDGGFGMARRHQSGLVVFLKGTGEHDNFAMAFLEDKAGKTRE